MSTARVYSTRFLAIHGTNLQQNYQVPIGYRAVLRSMNVTNASGAAISAYVGIGATYAFIVQNLAAGETRAVDTRVVCYGGEQIGAAVSAATGDMIVSGYLFKEGPAAMDAPEGADVGDPPVPAGWEGE